MDAAGSREKKVAALASVGTAIVLVSLKVPTNRPTPRIYTATEKWKVFQRLSRPAS
jgi:hypothetical protein